MKTLTHINLATIIFASLFLTSGTSLAIEVGDKEPTFSGESTHGAIHLVDFAGKQNVILALYFAKERKGQIFEFDRILTCPWIR